MRSRASLSAASASRLAGFFRGVDFGRAHAHRDLGKIETIEFERELQQRAVAVGFHLGEDIAHGFLDVGRGLALVREKAAKLRREIGALAVEA